MTTSPSTSPQPETSFEAWGLVTAVATIVTLLAGFLLIQPRLSERRVEVDPRFILTPAEVRDLPEGTLPVVLDRSAGQTEADFYFRLLQLVMERSGRPYALGMSEEDIPQDEAVAALEQDTAAMDNGRNPMAISVGVYGAGRDLNRRLQAIPIPVTGGILGLRAGWTHRDEVEALASVQSRDDLQNIVLLQGLGWSDVDIFDAAGMRTFTERSGELLRLVDNRRVQLFPRGIAELALDTTRANPSTSATVLDPNLLIAYPFAGFFYVSQSNAALAEALKIGFQRAISDGSYQRLVEELILTPWLREQLRLQDRVVVVLPNPVAWDVLADVDPAHWIVPWRDLLKGNIQTGSELCKAQGLRALCQQ